MVKVVQLDKPTHIDDMVDWLERLKKRLLEGEYETVLVLGFQPDGKWFIKELGRRHSRIEMVGILEMIKTDVIACTETDEPSPI